MDETTTMRVDASEAQLGGPPCGSDNNHVDACHRPKKEFTFMMAMDQMEAAMVERVARMALSASDDSSESPKSHDVSFSLEELLPAFSACQEAPTHTAPDNDAAQRQSSKRNSSFLATPIQSYADYFLPTPLISNKDHGQSCKKRRSNGDEIGMPQVPLLPASPVFDDRDIPVFHRPCFSPLFLRSSIAVDGSGDDDDMLRKDYKSAGGFSSVDVGKGAAVKDAADTKTTECPSLAPSRSSSPCLDNLPYLDTSFSPLNNAPRVRILKMRTKAPVAISSAALLS